jgi:hypothetical protein
MQTNRLVPDDAEGLAHHSSFRTAFSQARDEGRGVSLDVAAVHQAARYEVRIEKRAGKRAADAACWNRLGQQGWMLVAVVGKQAFFRREQSGS